MLYTFFEAISDETGIRLAQISCYCYNSSTQCAKAIIESLHKINKVNLDGSIITKSTLNVMNNAVNLIML
jgi:hypothetical protein